MLHKNLFQQNKEEYQNQIEKVFFTLAEFDDDTNLIVKVDNLEGVSKDLTHIFPAEEAVQIGAILSKNQNKNVFLINESYNEDLKNIHTGLIDNFYKLYSGFSKTVFKFLNNKEKEVNLSFLNIQSPLVYQNNKLEESLYIDNPEIKNDIALFRNLGAVNIFVPADANEARYLLKVTEKSFFKDLRNDFSYFRLSGVSAPKIFDENYFEKEGNLKEWTGIPEIVYVSRNLDSPFEIGIIASGPILYNAIYAAKELEKMNYKVVVLNMSLIASNDKYKNEKIRGFIQNFVDTYKNILTIEEHSKIGGMGSLIAEIVAESRDDKFVRVERMGLEDDLSPRNIISRAEEITRL